MNIIYLGKFFPQSMLRTIKEDCKGVMGLSNHNFEMSLLNGLCQQEGINLKCITCPGVFSYPQYNKRMFTKSESYDYKNTHVESVGFCNFISVKEVSAKRATASKIQEAIESFEGNTVHIIVNTPDIRLLDAIKVAKQKTEKKITQTVVIPDIPSIVFGMDKQNLIKSYFLAKRSKKITEATNNSDGLVLLTEAMMDFYRKDLKHIVMEGIVDVGTMDKNDVIAVEDKKVILYTGTLRKIFGVMNLIKAFQIIPDEDVELWICGVGDSKDAIEQAAANDNRIKFFGLVDSKTALEMQHKAMILVNPRTSEGEFTKYSFPSKTMEYLLAGKSVVINRLPGIPNEYYEYVYTPENESIESFAKCIMDVLHMDDKSRDARAVAGRRFIVKEKNSKVQMARVLNLIKTY